MKRRVLIQVGNVLMPIQDMTDEEALSHNTFNLFKGSYQIGSAKFTDSKDTKPSCNCLTIDDYFIFSTTVFLIVDKRVSS